MKFVNKVTKLKHGSDSVQTKKNVTFHYGSILLIRGLRLLILQSG